MTTTTRAERRDALLALRADMYAGQVFPPLGMTDAERGRIQLHNAAMREFAELCNYLMRSDTNGTEPDR